MEFFKYDTYQDVRINIVKWALVVFVLAGVFVQCMLSPELNRLLESVVPQAVPRWVTTTLTVPAVFFVISFLLFEIVKFHDCIYDKYVIKWRYRYAADVILPRLLRPFAHRLSKRFLEELDVRPGPFEEKLFYPFVGDRDRKIRENLLVRFYEQVTVYWGTQVNELAVLVVASTAVLYWLIARPSDPEYLNRIVMVLTISMLAFAANRWWIRSIRERVREATLAAIDEIIDRFSAELETAVKTICRESGFPYDGNA